MIGLRTFILLAVMLLVAWTPASAEPERRWRSVDEVLAQLPSRCEAFVLVPSLKRLSDRFTETLECMDRARFLLGSRPIDQLKSALGVVGNVDDRRGAAIAFVPHDDGGSVPRIVFVVPVTDAQAFIEANLTATPVPGRYRLGSTQIVYVRPADDFVVLSLDAPLDEGEKLGLEGAQRFREALHPDEAQALGKAHLTVYASRAGSRWVTGLIPTLVEGVEVPDWLTMLPAGVEYGIACIEVDALAVGITVLWRCDPDSALGRACAGVDAPKRRGLRRLQARPYYLAIGMDIAGLGGQATYDAFRQIIPLPLVPTSFLSADRVEIAAWAGSGTRSGGFIPDGLAVFETASPAAMRQSLRDDVEALADAEGPVAWTASWQMVDAPGQERIDAIAIAGALSPDAPSEVVQFHAVLSLLLGPAGIGTLVGSTQDAVVVTLGDDPARLAGAIQAASGSGPMLDDDGAIRMLRTWLPARVDVEAYIGVGTIAERLDPIRTLLATMGVDSIPPLDPSLPPVAMAFDIEDGAIRGSLVLPSTVLGVMMDDARRRVGK
jgi:hypothetical protein